MKAIIQSLFLIVLVAFVLSCRDNNRGAQPAGPAPSSEENDFSISIVDTIRIVRGNSGMLNIGIGKQGDPGYVLANLSGSSLLRRLSKEESFSSDKINYGIPPEGNNLSAVVVLTVGADIPAGNYKLAVTGKSSENNLSHKDDFILTVEKQVEEDDNEDKIIASGDLGTGDLDQWTAIQPGGAIDVSADVVRQGKYSARFTITAGGQYKETSGERSELSDLFPQSETYRRPKNGDDRYYAWSTYLDAFPDMTSWGVITQWHNTHPGGEIALNTLQFTGDGNSTLAFSTTGGRCAIEPDGGYDCRGNHVLYKLLDRMQLEVWHDFVFPVKWSCGNDGRVEVWHKLAGNSRYKMLLDIHRPTLWLVPAEDSDGRISYNYQSAYIKQGLYRDNSNAGTTILYHDGTTVGTSFKAVTMHAQRL